MITYLLNIICVTVFHEELIQQL